MKFTEFMKLAGVYILIYITVSFIYVLLFSTSAFNTINVFFYRGIALLFVSGLISVCLGLAVKRFWLRHIMTYRDILLIFTVFCCVNMVIFTHVPVTCERSISIFMLGYMAEESDRVFTEQEIEDFFISRYVVDYGAFKKRFYEQVVTGTVKTKDNGYFITDRGKSLIKMYDLIADWFHIDKKLIYPLESR